MYLVILLFLDHIAVISLSCCLLLPTQVPDVEFPAETAKRKLFVAVIFNPMPKVFQLGTKGIIQSQGRNAVPFQRYDGARASFSHGQRMDQRSQVLPLAVGSSDNSLQAETAIVCWKAGKLDTLAFNFPLSPQ